MIKAFKLVLGLTGAAWLGLIALPATADEESDPAQDLQDYLQDSGPACGYESLEAADRAGAAC